MTAERRNPSDSTVHDAPADSPPGRRVLLTTDCGTEMDDQWALAHLQLVPSLDLVAVVTTHAPNLPPPAAETSAAEARRVLAQVPCGSAVPVLPGSSVPLENHYTPRQNPGVDRIIAEARKDGPGPLAVLVIGAATDVASALLLAPDIAERIEVVAMGFQSWEQGGDEWNVKNDPAAWRALLVSPAPITVGDATVCKQFLCLSGSEAEALLGNQGSVGRFLAQLMVTWLRANGGTARAVTGQEDRWPVWDEVTVAHLLGMTRWETRPRPALRDDLTFEHGVGTGVVRWIRSVDAEGLWADLAGRCSAT